MTDKQLAQKLDACQRQGFIGEWSRYQSRPYAPYQYLIRFQGRLAHGKWFRRGEAIAFLEGVKAGTDG